jgi:hypothetical protein
MIMIQSQMDILNNRKRLLQEKIEKRRKERRGSRMMSNSMADVGDSTLSKVKKLAPAGAKRGRKRRIDEDEEERMPDTDISYEQKRELSDNINILPPDKLPQVFEIIKENTNLNVWMNF